jgi:hypothetical protein
MIKIIFFARKFYFSTIISVRSTLLREKGRIRILMDPDPYLRLTDPDPGGSKTYGAGTLLFRFDSVISARRKVTFVGLKCTFFLIELLCTEHRGR